MGRTQTETPKYVYGVVPGDAGSPPRVRGIGRKQIKVVRADGLGALTSDVPPGDLEAGREELLAHSKVLERALEQGTVLPMQFGVVMPNEAAVRDQLLDPHRPELEEQLREMNGKVEVNVKAIYDEQAVLSEVINENPQIERLRTGLRGKPEDATYYDRIQMGELIAEAMNAKRDGDGSEILHRLAPHADEIEVGQPVHERMVVNASFLIERGRLNEFNAGLDQIASEQGDRMRFKYVGPVAPHSFVELAMVG